MKIIFEEERKFLNEKLNIDLPTDCWRKVSKIYLDQLVLSHYILLRLIVEL